MFRVVAIGSALAASLGVLPLIASGKVLLAAPYRPAKAATPFAESLEGLAAPEVRAKDLARRRLLQMGPDQAHRLHAVRDELSEMLSKSKDLKSADSDKAVPAIRYFEKYGAAEYVALALANSNDSVVITAVKSLSDLNAKSVLPQVLDALKHHNFIKEGSEEATIHEILVASLLRLVNKLSGKEYKASPVDTEAIADIIKDARKK
jgi:hypothetical protein